MCNVCVMCVWCGWMGGCGCGVCVGVSGVHYTLHRGNTEHNYHILPLHHRLTNSVNEELGLGRKVEVDDIVQEWNVDASRCYVCHQKTTHLQAEECEFMLHSFIRLLLQVLLPLVWQNEKTPLHLSFSYSLLLSIMGVVSSGLFVYSFCSP